MKFNNALHSRGWLESEARAVARWRGLGRNGREVEYWGYWLITNEFYDSEWHFLFFKPITQFLNVPVCI